MASYKFVMIVGLPGSGKTTLGEQLLAAAPDMAILFDDFSKHATDYIHDFNPDVHKYVIVTDPALCTVEQRQAEHSICELLRLAVQDVEFYWIYFENDPEAALVNSERVAKPGGVRNYTRILSAGYTIPSGADVRPVYKIIH